MAKIVLEHVTKLFDPDVVAVNDLSLDIADGEFIVLVGPSGCGKTTVLRLLAGLEEVTAGEITIGERDVTDLDPRDRDVAMVFQSYALYPQMTVEQNVGFGLKVRKVARNEMQDRIRKTATMLGLDSLLARKPAALSGGQRQRVAMGRAVVRDPQAFLMDEPLSNLDAKLRVQMRAELAALHDRLGTTTVYVTHDQVEAMTLGQRVAVLRDGKLQQVATPQQLYRNPANLFVAAFIGSPSMNLVEATIAAGSVSFAGFDIPLADADGVAAYVGSSLILGIRRHRGSRLGGERRLHHRCSAGGDRGHPRGGNRGRRSRRAHPAHRRAGAVAVPGHRRPTDRVPARQADSPVARSSTLLLLRSAHRRGRRDDALTTPVTARCTLMRSAGFRCCWGRAR